MFKPETSEPIKRSSNTELLNIYASENNEILRTDGKELFCKICKKSISFATKYLVYRHLKSKKHQKIIPNKIIETENDLSKNIGIFETDKEILARKVSQKSIAVVNRLPANQSLTTRKRKTKHTQIIGRSSRDQNNKNSLEESHEELDFCKTCMKQFSKTKQNVNDKQNITEIPTGCGQSNTSIMELLIFIQPQIKVETKGNYPTFMCSDCIEKLMVSYKFIEMYRNSDKKLQKILAKFNEQDEQKEKEFESNRANKLINIHCSEKVSYEEGNQQSELEELSIKVLSENTESECAIFPDHNNESSDDDWAPKKSCLNISREKLNSVDDDDDVTRKVFKGFFQPDENKDGSLTCQLCESVLDGVLPWREHIRQNHFEEKPKRAYSRRKKVPSTKGSQKVPKKFLPNEKGLFQCEYCEKSYPKYLFYRRHVRTHAEGIHLCIECGKSFSNITSYNSHMLRHKGEKNFACSQCPKCFVCPSDLYGHMMTHTNSKPNVCDICGAAFRMPYQLRNHNRMHTGIKNYQCEYCDMRFKSRPNQICHMRTHTGEKPFHCKYCEKAFAQSGDCVKHMRQHLGDNNVYLCDLCPLRFPLVRDLRAHFASHKDDDEETRNRNLQARMEEEQKLKIKLECRKSM